MGGCPSHRSMFACLFLLSWLTAASPAQDPNQTTSLSPVYASGMPFRSEVRQLETERKGLPGLHSGCSAILESQPELLVFFGGRSNLAGMHGFDCGDGSFAKDDFNRSMFLAIVETGEVWERSVDVPESGLSTKQADQLSAVNYLDNQLGDHLISIGGYGYSREDQDWVTFDTLALIEIQGLADWIRGGSTPLAESIRFLDPPGGAPGDLYTNTGGKLHLPCDEMWTCLGQEFQGRYDPCDPSVARQTYKKDFFRLRVEEGRDGWPTFTYLGNSPESQEAFARRRDLNILPAVVDAKGGIGMAALSGVFTEADGCWTVPILLGRDGSMIQADPASPRSFKQGYNVYSSAAMTAWSESEGVNWFIIGGGISYQLLDHGRFSIPGGFPYSTNLSAIRFDPASDEWAQFFLNESFPRIPAGPGDQAYWRFGSEMYMFPVGDAWNSRTKGAFLRILDLDAITEPTTIGYLYGGIAALGSDFDAPNFATVASPYGFEVILVPGPGCPADFTDSGVVGGQDLGALLAAWGQLPIGTSAIEDLNDDGWVSGIDLAMLLQAWGPCSN